MSNFQRLTGHCRTCLTLYSQRLTVRWGDEGFNWLSGVKPLSHIHESEHDLTRFNVFP